jgi:hypothetical protein
MAFNIILRNPGTNFNIKLSTIFISSAFKTYVFDSSHLLQTKNYGQFGTSLGMGAYSANPQTWILTKIQHSSNMFYPLIHDAEGSPKYNIWRWVSGSSALLQ